MRSEVVEDLLFRFLEVGEDLVDAAGIRDEIGEGAATFGGKVWIRVTVEELPNAGGGMNKLS